MFFDFFSYDILDPIDTLQPQTEEAEFGSLSPATIYRVELVFTGTQTVSTLLIRTSKLLWFSILAISDIF